jgi:hypothetical protein
MAESIKTIGKIQVGSIDYEITTAKLGQLNATEYAISIDNNGNAIIGSNLYGEANLSTKTGTKG